MLNFVQIEFHLKICYMKILFLDAKTVGKVPNFNLIEKFGELKIHQTTTPDQRLERIKGKDIIITNKVVIDREVIAQSPELKLICVAATGTNNVDINFAREKGISVKNVVGYSTNAIAQGTFALLFYLLNQTAYYDNYVKSGKYSQSGTFTHIGHEFVELAGKQFGIIGLGNIGKKVAKIAKNFGCKVSYYSTSGKNTYHEYPSISIDELLENSDIVSIHAPLNENTFDLINYSKLKLMKPTAFIINMGRGSIVNEYDLAKALDENLIEGAGLDVFEKEPIEEKNPLLHIKNKRKLVMTPHSSWTSIDTRVRLIEEVAKNIEEYIELGY